VAAAGVGVSEPACISPVRLGRKRGGGRPGASMRFMTALPADPQHQDPLDPERILRELPERERENFLSQYREALDGARTEDSISSAQTPRSCLISTKNAQ